MTSDEYFERKMKLIDKNGKGSGGTKKSGGKDPTWGNKSMGVVGI